MGLCADEQVQQISSRSCCIIEAKDICCHEGAGEQKNITRAGRRAAQPHKAIKQLIIHIYVYELLGARIFSAVV